MPNSFSPSNPNSSQNSANTPDYSPNPDSTNTPDTANSPDSTNNASSNTGNSDNKIFLLHTLVYLINSPWLAGFSKNYPRLGNLLAILIPVLSFFLGSTPSIYPILPVASKSNLETKIDLNGICKTLSMREQMLADAQNKGVLDDEIKNTDNIVPLELGTVENDTRYPVFRWKCDYEINEKDAKNEKDQSPTPTYWIGLDLNEYCKKQAEENGTDLIEAAYHNYRDPHSFYCVNPYPS